MAGAAPAPAPAPAPGPVFTVDAPPERFVISTSNAGILEIVKAIQALGAAIDKYVPCGENKVLAVEALEAVQDRSRRGITAPLDWK